MDSALSRQFAALSTQGKCLATYIWFNSKGVELHEATRVLSARPDSVHACPLWNTLDMDNSLLMLQPCSLHADPIRGGAHILVLCSSYKAPCAEDARSAEDELHPHPSNNRAPCDRAMRAASASQPVFSCQQQYTLLDPQTHWPIGWPERATALESCSQSYCAVGHGAAVGRDFAESHMRACLHAGLRVAAIQAEAMPGQWSYTVGPCRGIELGDHVWLSRYLLLRLSEQFKVIASTDPKPVPGDWLGNGAPIKFSTRETRQEGKGWFVIQEHLRRLQQAHMKHIVAYGVGNAKRWENGGGAAQQPGSLLDFSVGMEDRRASIRIPHSVLLQKRGWYEDRRPASNMDPYLVTMLLVCTALQLPLPSCSAEPGRGNAQHSSSTSTGPTGETISRGSSAILDEIDDLDSFAPDTPPQNVGLLATECSSENDPHTADTCMCL